MELQQQENKRYEFEVDRLIDLLNSNKQIKQYTDEDAKEDDDDDEFEPMIMFWPGDVQKFQRACMEKYPSHQSTIDKIFNDIKGYNWYDNEEKNAAMLKRTKRKNEMLRKYAKKATNVSFDQQKNLAKRIVEADIGEESEYESGMSELSTLEDVHWERRQTRSQLAFQNQSHRIFKFLKMLNPKVTLPAQKPAKSESLKDIGPLTLYIELEEVLMYGFIVDQNFGYMAKPTSKDPEHEVFI